MSTMPAIDKANSNFRFPGIAPGETRKRIKRASLVSEEECPMDETECCYPKLHIAYSDFFCGIFNVFSSATTNEGNQYTHYKNLILPLNPFIIAICKTEVIWIFFDFFSSVRGLCSIPLSVPLRISGIFSDYKQEDSRRISFRSPYRLF